MMVSYLNRLECLIERWQSKRKTIKISQANLETTKAKVVVEGEPTNWASNDKNHLPDASNTKSSNNLSSLSNTSPASTIQPSQLINNARGGGGDKRNGSLIEAMKMETPIIKLTDDGIINDNHDHDHGHDNDRQRLGTGESNSQASSPSPDRSQTTTTYHHHHQQQHHHQSSYIEPTLTPKLSIMMLMKSQPQTPTGGLIYMLSIFVLLLLILPGQQQQHSGLTHLIAAQSVSPLDAEQTTAKGLSGPRPEVALQLGQLGWNLIQRLSRASPAQAQRDRWIQVPGDRHSIRDPPDRRLGRIGKLLSTLRNQIGARNTIRVHNAFRDFAWRLLSSLSMPTPVIYELRRQHLYTPEDDLMNDSFFNKNTTRTIRSKRQLLKFWPAMERRLTQETDYNDMYKSTQSRASSDDDDDDDSFRDRLRSRLEDLFDLRGRNRFLRVVRVPSLFPFKRQEDDHSKNHQTRGRRAGRRRRRRKDDDRQKIQINGKHYYVNDEGELKELNNDHNKK